MHTHLRSTPTLLSTYFRGVLFVSLGFVSMVISTRVFCCYPFWVPFFHIAEKCCSDPMTQYKVSRAISGAVELLGVASCAHDSPSSWNFITQGWCMAKSKDEKDWLKPPRSGAKVYHRRWGCFRPLAQASSSWIWLLSNEVQRLSRKHKFKTETQHHWDAPC